jgi:outer membrane protein assembly factor BamB
MTGYVMARRGVAYATSLIYTPTGTKARVYALGTRDGRLRWSRPGGGVGIRIAHGDVYANDWTSDLYLWNAKTGHRDGHYIDTGLAVMVDRKRMYNFHNEYIAAHRATGCMAWRPCSSPRWDRYVGEIFQTALARKTLFVGNDSDEILMAINAKTGTLRWQTDLPGSSLSAAGNVLYAATQNYVRAYPMRCETPCQPLWQSEPLDTTRPSVNGPAAIVNGTVVFTQGKSLIAYRLP